ncbi:MAG: hypothetical protein ACLUI7_02785 [Coprococcus sp.]
MTEMKMPRVMIAAPGSGSGKTMITCGLLELLRRAGRPISFKCGPDYIDPMFHRFVLNIPSRNLDTFFTVPDRTRSLMGKACMKEGADLAVIEGVGDIMTDLAVFLSEAAAMNCPCRPGRR